MSVQDVIRLRQREQSVHSYTERDIIGFQCKTPHYKDECTCECSVVQKPSALVYRGVQKSDTVRWVILHYILHKCMWSQWYRPECWTHTVRGSGGSAILWGTFCWYGLSPFVPFEGSDHLYPMTFLSWWRGEGVPMHWAQMGCQWMVWWIWKWCESYAVAFAVREILDQERSPPTFWRMVFIPPVELQRLVKSLRSCFDSSWWPNTVICHPSLGFIWLHVSEDYYYLTWSL